MGQQQQGFQAQEAEGVSGLTGLMATSTSRRAQQIRVVHL